MCNGKDITENSSSIQNIHKKKTNKSVHNLYGSKYKNISDTLKQKESLIEQYTMFIHGKHYIVQMSIVLKLFTCLWLTCHQQMSGSPVCTRHQGRHWVRTEGRTHLKIMCHKESPYCQSLICPWATRFRFLLASYRRFQEKWEPWSEASSLRLSEKKNLRPSGVRKDPCVSSARFLSPQNKVRVPPTEPYLCAYSRKPTWEWPEMLSLTSALWALELVALVRGM